MNTADELRDFLATQLQRVAKGELSPAHANASANLAGKMLSTVKMELDYCKASGFTPTIDFLGINGHAANQTKRLETVDHATGEVIKTKN